MDELEVEEAIEGITIGICVRKEDRASQSDVAVVIEGNKAVEGLESVALAVALLFGLMYAINLSYPANLRYTFEVIQKIFMELDPGRLSKKAQALKSRLQHH